jgi:hypothetical protein
MGAATSARCLRPELHTPVDDSHDVAAPASDYGEDASSVLASHHEQGASNENNDEHLHPGKLADSRRIDLCRRSILRGAADSISRAGIPNLGTAPPQLTYPPPMKSDSNRSTLDPGDQFGLLTEQGNRKWRSPTPRSSNGNQMFRTCHGLSSSPWSFNPSNSKNRRSVSDAAPWS